MFTLWSLPALAELEWIQARRTSARGNHHHLQTEGKSSWQMAGCDIAGSQRSGGGTEAARRAAVVWILLELFLTGFDRFFYTVCFRPIDVCLLWQTVFCSEARPYRDGGGSRKGCGQQVCHPGCCDDSLEKFQETPGDKSSYQPGPCGGFQVPRNCKAVRASSPSFRHIRGPNLGSCDQSQW